MGEKSKWARESKWAKILPENCSSAKLNSAKIPSLKVYCKVL